MLALFRQANPRSELRSLILHSGITFWLCQDKVKLKFRFGMGRCIQLFGRHGRSPGPRPTSRSGRSFCSRPKISTPPKPAGRKRPTQAEGKMARSRACDVFASWAWLKIKQEGQTVGYGPCFTSPGNPFWFRFFFLTQPVGVPGPGFGVTGPPSK